MDPASTQTERTVRENTFSLVLMLCHWPTIPVWRHKRAVWQVSASTGREITRDVTCAVFYFQGYKGKVLRVDIKITASRRQCEHREASYNRRPKLTRDAMHMRNKKKERERRQQIALQGTNSSYVSRSLFPLYSLLLMRCQNNQFSN